MITRDQFLSFAKGWHQLNVGRAYLDEIFFASYSAVHYFQHLLERQTLYILTGDKPLLGAFQSSSDSYSLRETKHLGYLLQYILDIHFIKGGNDVSADAMSRGIKLFCWTGVRNTNILWRNRFCRPTIAAASSRQLHISEIVKNTGSGHGCRSCVWHQHGTCTSFCTRDVTENIVLLHLLICRALVLTHQYGLWQTDMCGPYADIRQWAKPYVSC